MIEPGVFVYTKVCAVVLSGRYTLRIRMIRIQCITFING
jgi:hypothetical protein